MIRSCLLLSIICAFLLPPSYGQSPVTAGVDLIMKEYTGSDKPGAVIGIIENGKMVFAKGYGMANLALQWPNGPGMQHKIASVTKQFTAAAVQLLIQGGKLEANDDIRKYIPAFPDYGKVITVENLLYHTSGIRDYMVLMWLTGISFEETMTNAAALDIIYRQKALNFIPGQRCVYSNSNYVLLAEIVRKVSGMPLNEFAESLLLKPLGMSRSRFGNNDSVALSYRSGEKGYTPYRNSNAVIGDGGMYSTLEDLLRWDNTFYDSTAITRFILRRGKLENGNILYYGQGIMFGNYKGALIQSHPGAILGYRAEMLRFPDKKITVICLGNNENINPETITRSIADLYVFKQTPSPAPAAPAIRFDPGVIGRYEVNPEVQIDVRRDGNLLTGQLSGQPAQVLYADSGRTYTIGATGDKAVFDDNGLTVIQKNGSVKAAKLAVAGREKYAQFTGQYFSKEQNATYALYERDGALWFKTGNNAPVKAEILEKYDRLYFRYQNLEQASINFQRDSSGVIKGFVLNSGRVQGLNFDKL